MRAFGGQCLYCPSHFYRRSSIYMANVCCTQKDIYLKYEFVVQVLQHTVVLVVHTLVLCITGHFKDKGGRFKANMKLFAKAIGKRLDWFGHFE